MNKLTDAWHDTLTGQLAALRLGPVGVWATVDGDPVIGEGIWRFWPDGVGKYQLFGVFGAPAAEPVRFEWVPAGDWMFRTRVPNEEGEPGKWLAIRFCCRLTEGRVRSLEMVERSLTGEPLAGFGSWLWPCPTPGPVEWRGPLEGAGREAEPVAAPDPAM